MFYVFLTFLLPRKGGIVRVFVPGCGKKRGKRAFFNNELAHGAQFPEVIGPMRKHCRRGRARSGWYGRRPTYKHFKMQSGVYFQRGDAHRPRRRCLLPLQAGARAGPGPPFLGVSPPQVRRTKPLVLPAREAPVQMLSLAKD